MTVGAKCCSAVHRFAACQQPTAVVERISDMSDRLGDRAIVEQRGLVAWAIETSADLQGRNAGGQRCNEAIINPNLDEKAVGAHAGLVCVAKFRSNFTFHCCVEIGIVEDTERSVDTKFRYNVLSALYVARRQHLTKCS